MSHTTSIVILNWNGIEHLKTFLTSVVEHSHNAEIIIADNASTDESIQWLEQQYSQITIITLSQNYGYAGGYNEALKFVESEYLVLLNSDIEVTSGWLEPLIQCLNENPTVAACQPKIKNYTNKKYFEYAGAAGGYIDYLGIPFCKGRILSTTEIDCNQYDYPAPIFWASGACLVLRNDVFKKAGGFDADFFAHMEEIDLCWKIHRLGYTIQFVPQSTVYHLGGGTLNKTNPKKTYLNVRNSLWMLQNHLPNNALIPIIIYRMVLDGVAAINFLRMGQVLHFVAIFKAHMSFYMSGKNKAKRKSLVHLPFFYKNTPLILKKSIIRLYFLKGKKTYTSVFNHTEL